MEADSDYRNTVFALMRTAGYRPQTPPAFGERGYRGANSPETGTAWSESYRSADGEIAMMLPVLRVRSRELERDDPIGSGLVRTFRGNVVTSELRPQAETGDSDKDQRLEAVWRERKDQLFRIEDISMAQGQRMLYEGLFVAGDIGLWQRKDGPDDPLWFDIIEGDRVMMPLGYSPWVLLPNGNEVRLGVELAPDGRKLAFYVRKRHPGDIFAVPRPDFMNADRVPVEVFRLIRRPTRPGQTRGVPFLHAVLQDLHDLDLLLLASMKRVQVASLISAFIKSPLGAEEMFELTSKKFGMKLDQQLEPGMIFKLFPDEEIQTVVPNFPTPEFEPFIKVLCRRIGTALGISWQIVLKDFSQSTYSSARTDQLEARHEWLIQRADFAADMTWMWAAVMTDALVRGDPRMANCVPADFQKVRWIGDPWKWIDPATEVEALIAEMEAGLKTHDDAWAEMGFDRDERRQALTEEAEVQELLQSLRPAEPAPAEAAGEEAAAGAAKSEKKRGANVLQRRFLRLLQQLADAQRKAA